MTRICEKHKLYGNISNCWCGDCYDKRRRAEAEKRNRTMISYLKAQHPTVREFVRQKMWSSTSSLASDPKPILRSSWLTSMDLDAGPVGTHGSTMAEPPCTSPKSLVATARRIWAGQSRSMISAGLIRSRWSAGVRLTRIIAQTGIDCPSPDLHSI